ncbi:hypothetical protein E2C01_040654 [Portunus trituberculatus]|uniref:Uncharacterized protein n=1 Tax=Portunus trituberculatus TaxID=210409 RepID=A0A5B7FPC8_PORTR|nr:hypothetical protein [Portunus trituberculatus]
MQYNMDHCRLAWQCILTQSTVTQVTRHTLRHGKIYLDPIHKNTLYIDTPTRHYIVHPIRVSEARYGRLASVPSPAVPLLPSGQDHFTTIILFSQVTIALTVTILRIAGFLERRPDNHATSTQGPE